MLNTSEYQFIRDIVLQMYNQGYEYYICVTNNPINDFNNVYDVECYFSQQITQNTDNRFTLSPGIKISLDSNSYSNNNTIDKLKRDMFNSYSLTTSKTEYVYSNVGHNSNMIADYETSLNNHLTINFAYMIPAILILEILINFIRSCFRKRS